MKKKLLIYAHYYIPDVASTGQILYELSDGLKKEFDITVICAVPSYGGTVSSEYKEQIYYEEYIEGVRVLRIRVPEFSKSNKFSRVKNIIAYYFGARHLTRIAGPQDYIFAISQPPILGGMLGSYGKRKNNTAKFVYNIQDFNPEQIKAVNYSTNKVLIKGAQWLDNHSCRQADLVITVGRDLVETMNNRFAGKKVPETVLINNWIDEKTIYPLSMEDDSVKLFRNRYNLEDKFVIAYSGNLGLYYDLENIIKVIEKIKPGTRTSDGREVTFAFIGAGSLEQSLKDYVSEHRMSNVIFIPYQKKEDLVYSLNAVDVHWCVNAKGIKGVSCPSKYYGIAAAGKPVIGVLEEGSEIRLIIEENGGGLVCNPTDYSQIEKMIWWYIDNAGNRIVDEMGKKGREYLLKHLTREQSVNAYKDAIISLSDDDNICAKDYKDGQLLKQNNSKVDVKPKILYVVEAMGGGIFTYIVDLTNELAEFYDIYIAYAVRSQTPEDFKSYFDSRVHLIEVKNFCREINFFKEIKAVFEIKKIAKQIAPDVIHLHSSKAGVIGRVAFNGKKVPLFYTPHGYSFLMENYRPAKRYCFRMIEKWFANKNCTIISCSNGEHSESLKLTKQATYVNNAINIEKLEYALSYIQEESHPFTVFTLGRVCYQKNPVLFNEIAKRLPDIQFVWIGDGGMTDAITSSNIQITGWLDRKDALKVAMSADVFVLTSLWEGLPISLLEAMYMKKPCVVNNVIGNNDVIHNGDNGYVCNTVDEFVDAIIAIKNKQCNHLIDKAYKDILMYYNTKVQADSYRVIYENAIGN